MSLAEPSEITLEKPIALSPAQSRIAETSAPD
jgi:hypothetical protein